MCDEMQFMHDKDLYYILYHAMHDEGDKFDKIAIEVS